MSSRYLCPVSGSTVTMFLFSRSLDAICFAAQTFDPDETPTHNPSSQVDVVIALNSLQRITPSMMST